MKRKFVPMTGLDNLTQDEKAQYYQDACDFLGIPADQNLLEYIWLDGEMGRHLVLYAKRGATDLLREKHGISVIEMREVLGDGFVSFIARGKNKDGREDIAVGSATTKGLSGRALENSVMTAQTRASRRLTLQFVGGGLLDETEVNLPAQTIRTESTEKPEVFTPEPIVPLNENPGNPVNEQDAAGESMLRAALELAGRSETPVQEDSSKRKRKRRSAVELESPKQTQPIPKQSDPEQRYDLLQSAAQEAVDIVNEQKAPKAKYSLQKSVEYYADLIEPKESSEDKEIREMEERLSVLKAKKEAMPVVKNVVIPPPPVTPALVQAKEPPPPAPKPPKDAPKAEQLDGYKARMFKYVNEVFPSGGMEASEGIGGCHHKFRALARALFPETIETKMLTVQQWELLLGMLDEKYAEVGAKGLVQLVNARIGAK